jgi:3-phosphoshikimate 1-carboxyvinyltransferase
MNMILSKSKLSSRSEIQITGSKSETNRWLLLQALYPEIQISNASNSHDSEVMEQVIRDFKLQTNLHNQPPTINHQPSTTNQSYNIHHAGTAMRFLTAFFAIQDGKEVLLTGSSRMKERPIAILVNALRELGADISYEEQEGLPPLRIRGKKITKNLVSLPANVSSQYISALLLIAPKLENGLEITLLGETTSLPYIQMTLKMLQQIGVEVHFREQSIQIKPLKNLSEFSSNAIVESDWSSASYWYSMVALSEIRTKVTLSFFKENSLQGDVVLQDIYQKFGVETIFNSEETITLTKTTSPHLSPFTFHLINAPDIAQTIAVTCFGLGLACELTGLHTLKIKETDRLQALKNELGKLGAVVEITNDSLKLANRQTPIKEAAINTYQDHRMAMAFAPLSLLTKIQINEAEVVEKSYPDFWKDLQKVGFEFKENF